MANRTGKGYFPPGVSGNPGGRPLGFSHLIRERTNDGADLVDFALSILQGKRGARLQQRLEALQWLADRGWGRAVQSIEASGPGGGPIVVSQGPDLSQLSDGELADLERLITRISSN